MLYTICDQRTANWNKIGYRYTPVKMAKIQITDNTKCWPRCETRTLIHWCLECKIVSPLWKTLWQFLTNLNILLPHNPAVVLIGIYSNKLKIYVHTRTCRSSTGALFIIAKTWKQTALSFSCTVLSHSVVSDSLLLHRLQPARLFCPWGFSRQEHRSGLPCPPPGDLTNPGMEPRSLALQADSSLSGPPGKPNIL